MINIINDFVNGRQELWLEPRLKKAKTEEEQMQLLNEASEKFDLKNWLPDAAKRAGQLSMTTHPSKFTHPSAKSTSIIAENVRNNDGYLRSGNVTSPLDVFGNAAAMDVYRLLSLPVPENGEQTLLDAFESSDDALESCITGLGLNFESIRSDFMKIKIETGAVKTDTLLKQIYFPINTTQYHLLSLLTASGLITNLKKKVDDIRFSETTKLARLARREQKYCEHGYRDLFDLTITGYGGTKPQNISVLNNQNYGRSYLLSSIPPLFEKRAMRLPTSDFFIQTLYLKAESDRFIALHKHVLKDQNNIQIRQKIQKMIGEIIDQILHKAYQLRQNHNAGWSETEYYKGLPLYQKIWLDNSYGEKRQEDYQWRDDIAKDISRVMIAMYEDINQVKIFGDPELKHIQKLIIESIEEDKEFF